MISSSSARRVAAALLAAVASTVAAVRVPAQTPATASTVAVVPRQPVVIRGGWLFTATGDNVIRNRGILIVAGRLMAVDRAITPAEMKGARVIDLRDDQYVLPGIFDVHAHYNMTLGPSGLRSDEYTYNPLIFLANGVTSTFPAGEYDPEGMMEARKRIDSGEQIGPRIYNSGPYFGTRAARLESECHRRRHLPRRRRVGGEGRARVQGERASRREHLARADRARAHARAHGYRASRVRFPQQHQRSRRDPHGHRSRRAHPRRRSARSEQAGVSVVVDGRHDVEAVQGHRCALHLASRDVRPDDHRAGVLSANCRKASTTGSTSGNSSRRRCRRG